MATGAVWNRPFRSTLVTPFRVSSTSPSEEVFNIFPSASRISGSSSEACCDDEAVELAGSCFDGRGDGTGGFDVTEDVAGKEDNEAEFSGAIDISSCSGVDNRKTVSTPTSAIPSKIIAVFFFTFIYPAAIARHLLFYVQT